MADNVYQMTDHNRIREEASLWLSRLDGENSNYNLHRDFEQWLAADSRHRSMFKELSGVWSEMDILAIFQPLLEPDTTSQTTVEDAGPRVSKRLWVGFATAATLLIATIILALPLWQTGKEPLLYATTIGEQTNITLDDGSELHLNSNSVVEVEYSDHSRQLRLLRGEAFFDVAHNKNRPFVVRAGSGDVEAVGTAFAIQVDKSNVEVAVTEGRIKVTPVALSSTHAETPGERPMTYADAGQIVVYDQSIESLQTASDSQMQRLLSWRQGLLKFQGETLEQAIAEFNRYSKTRIVLSDPDLRELRIGGVFKTSDTEAFLLMLDEGFGIQVQKYSPKLVYLKKAIKQ